MPVNATTWPYHYRDGGGGWCRWSGVSHNRGEGAVCPSGCDGSRYHYTGDGHPQCDDPDGPQPVNTVAAPGGWLRVVCEFCDARSPLVQASSGGRVDLWDLPGGWTCAPYPVDYMHADGSTGSLWTCPVCAARLVAGESLPVHGSRGRGRVRRLG